MKKLNKKGFTLIELLAVIVILAILITVSVPAVTKYLNGARKDTYLSNAQSAISAVRTDVISSGVTADTFYKLTSTTDTGSIDYIGVNDLLEAGKGLSKSTYGESFNASSYILVQFNNGVASYSICLIDAKGNGIIDGTLTDGYFASTAAGSGTGSFITETSLTNSSIRTGLKTSASGNPAPTCTLPTDATERQTAIQ